MTLAVVPARGGSKRIPRKNLREFFGKPIIAWSLEAALESDCFSRVIVSTDDEEIASVAREHGAEVPFLRPAELADDITGTVPVMAHAVEACGLAPEELACCIYATAPFVTAEDLARGRGVLEAAGTEYALSVTTFPFPIQRALRAMPGGRLAPFSPEHEQSRSQDLEEAWHDAGQFYWGRARAWRANAPIFASGPAPVPLPRHRVQDIDTPEDWSRAELLFQALRDRGQAD